VGCAGKDTGKTILKKIVFTFIFTFFSLSELLSQSNCSLRKDRDGIKVYTCHTDTSRFKSIVAEFTINSSFNDLMDRMMDVDGYTKWQFNTVEAKVLGRSSQSEQIYRTIVEAPWPIIDRDMVVRMTVHVDENKNEASIDAESVKGILPSSNNYVRVPSSRAHWIVKRGKEKNLEVRYTMQIDPGGAVPSWLVNWVCAQAPYESFKNLKAILEKKK
jgi:hypothetical protein